MRPYDRTMATEGGHHGGAGMGPQASRPQLVAVATLSLLLLAAGIFLALLGQGQETRAKAIDVALALWFLPTALALAYVAWDAFTVTPQPVIMKWGWLLMTLYTGPLGAVLYVLSCQEPAPGEHERFVEPLWKQGLGSTIHCVANDATGVIASAVVTATLGQPMWLEYVAGFAFGLLVFQSLFMQRMLGGSYIEAVRPCFLPEWPSMNAMMAGMTFSNQSMGIGAVDSILARVGPTSMRKPLSRRERDDCGISQTSIRRHPLGGAP